MDQAAKRLNISPRHLQDLLKQGLIGYSFVGKKKRISTREIERILTPIEKPKDPVPAGHRRKLDDKGMADRIRALRKNR